ncbi:hypothetical protein ABPG72_005999 [Tetrahymena utriculariae]
MIFLLQFTLLALVSSFGKQVQTFVYTQNCNLEVSLLEYVIKTAVAIPYQISLNANSNRIFSLIFIFTTQFIVIYVDQIIVNSNWFIRYFMFEGFTVMVMPVYMHFSLHLGGLYYKKYLKIYICCYSLAFYLFYYTSIEYRGPIECIMFIIVSIYSYFHSIYLDHLEKKKDYIYYNDLEYKNENLLKGKRQLKNLQYVQLPSIEFLQVTHSRSKINHDFELKDIIYIGNYKGNHSVIQIYEKNNKNIFIIKSILFYRNSLSNYDTEQLFTQFRSQIKSFKFDSKMRILIIYRALQDFQGIVQIYSLSNLQRPIRIIEIAQNQQEEILKDVENKFFYYIDSNNNLLEISYLSLQSTSYKICWGFSRHKLKVFTSDNYKILVCYKENSMKLYLSSLTNKANNDQNEIYLFKQNIYIPIKQIFIYNNFLVVVTDTLIHLINPITFKVHKIIKEFHNFIKIKCSENQLLITQTVEKEDQFIINDIIGPTIVYSCQQVVNLAVLQNSNQENTYSQIILFLQNDRIQIIKNIWDGNLKDLNFQCDQLKI